MPGDLTDRRRLDIDGLHFFTFFFSTFRIGMTSMRSISFNGRSKRSVSSACCMITLISSSLRLKPYSAFSFRICSSILNLRISPLIPLVGRVNKSLAIQLSDNRIIHESLGSGPSPSLPANVTGTISGQRAARICDREFFQPKTLRRVLYSRGDKRRQVYWHKMQGDLGLHSGTTIIRYLEIAECEAAGYGLLAQC